MLRRAAFNVSKAGAVAISRRNCSEDPYRSLFPELSSLSPAEMRTAAGHFHLVMQDAWEGGSHTWEFSNLGDNVFDACGHKWTLDFKLVREPSVDEVTNSITGGTYRIYILTRLTRGHPIPIQADVTLQDDKGGKIQRTSSFYTPLQQNPESIISESFEILRVSCEADTAAFDGTIDVENLSSVTVTVSVCPQVIPKLISQINTQMSQMEESQKEEQK